MTDIAVAWIGFAGAVIAALISAFVAVRQRRVEERLARLNADLQAEVHRREAVIDREMNAEAVLTRYREPLAAAAYDLQSRLYNILEMDFFVRHGEATGRLEEAYRTTLFRLAQYLGWSEILRRDIQFLSFPEEEATRRVAQQQAAITRCLLTDEYGHAMMVWNDQQRALGELMIVRDDGKLMCMGYAQFSACCEETFGPWLGRLTSELRSLEAEPRLRDLQNHLADLVGMLDFNHLRYSDALEKVPTPAVAPGGTVSTGAGS